MNTKISRCLALCALAALLASRAAGDNSAEKRTSVQKMKEETLTKLYATEPSSCDRWDGSAQADAAAVATGKGGAWAGAVDVAPGIKLYQITENGLALQATIQGTKYWKDGELNAP